MTRDTCSTINGSRPHARRAGLSDRSVGEDITLPGPLRRDCSLHLRDRFGLGRELIDVYSGDYPNPDRSRWCADGRYQQLVRGEAFRGKFRNSFSKPEPFEPGKMTKGRVRSPDAHHTFARPSHMAQVQSSWSRSWTQSAEILDIYHAREEDFKATQRVYHSPQPARIFACRFWHREMEQPVSFRKIYLAI